MVRISRSHSLLPHSPHSVTHLLSHTISSQHLRASHHVTSAPTFTGDTVLFLLPLARACTRAHTRTHARTLSHTLSLSLTLTLPPNHALAQPRSHAHMRCDGVGVCSVAEILKDRAATCLAVAGKFLVLGTDWGNIHVLDTISGNECKTFDSHQVSSSHSRSLVLYVTAQRVVQCRCCGDVCGTIRRETTVHCTHLLSIDPSLPWGCRRGLMILRSIRTGTTSRVARMTARSAFDRCTQTICKSCRSTGPSRYFFVGSTAPVVSWHRLPSFAELSVIATEEQSSDALVCPRDRRPLPSNPTSLGRRSGSLWWVDWRES